MDRKGSHKPLKSLKTDSEMASRPALPEGEPLRRIPGENPYAPSSRILRTFAASSSILKGLVKARIEHPVVDDGVARIAGRVQHPEVWPFLPRAIGELSPRHVRHDDVGE